MPFGREPPKVLLERWIDMQRFSIQSIRASWAALPVRYRGAVVITIPAFCLLITLGAWVWSRESLLNVRRRIEHSDKIIQESADLLSGMINAETGVRGYAITQNPDFLDPYRKYATNLDPVLQQLRQLLAENPQQLNELNEIERLIRNNQTTFQQLLSEIAASSQVGAPSPQVQQLIYQSKRNMDALRSAIAIFQQEEQSHKANRLAQRERVQQSTTLAILLTSAISVLGFWAALYLFTQIDRNLTDREQRLQESKSLLQALVDSVVDGVIILDADDRIEIFNPTASEMFGYAPEEVIGSPPDRLFTAPLLQSSALLSPAVPSPNLSTSSHTQTARGVRRDQSTFPVALSISNVELDDRRLVVIIRDMTEVQQTQEKLQDRADELARLTGILTQTNSTLEDRNRELEQFAYVASHDLKAPLRAIANLSEWIEEDLQGQLPAENQHQMKLLRGRVLRMEALINGLLDYSRAGRKQVEVELVSVKALLAEVIDSLSPPDTFTIEIAPDMPVLNTKRILLRQVFANLINNAIKHHDRGDGHLWIDGKDCGDRYEFIVTDDGPGIDPAFHEKIFVIFQTLEARDTKESTGVGLAIVKKIVEFEGGDIWVESAKGAGAAFHFTWPKPSEAIS
jgi:PAS domain S-box-containing protein